MRIQLNKYKIEERKWMCLNSSIYKRVIAGLYLLNSLLIHSFLDLNYVF